MIVIIMHSSVPIHVCVLDWLSKQMLAEQTNAQGTNFRTVCAQGQVCQPVGSFCLALFSVSSCPGDGGDVL